MSSSARKMAAAVAAGATVLAGLTLAPSATATPPGDSPSASLPGQDVSAVAAKWTPAARAAAVPRDLVIDERGLGYLKRADGSLEPYGHGTPAQAAQPRVVAVDVAGSPTVNGAKPQPSKGKPPSDTTDPVISINSPKDGSDLTAATLFSATVTDDGSVRSVALEYSYDGGSWLTTTTPPTNDGDTWSQTVTFNTDGPWRFRVTAQDAARNTASSMIAFTVSMNGSSGGTGGSNDGVMTNAPWTAGGKVQTAAGRIYFYMPSNKRMNRWTGYVCSGTAVTDGTSGRSIILTAAHCVYDDVNGAFAKDVMFIPNQAGTTGAGTDRNCDNDPIGCWYPSFGVVDRDWTTRTFPDNIPWDYAYYVVQDADPLAHEGNGVDGALDAAVSPLTISFEGAAVGDSAAALGYSYSDDPNFMYCAEPLAVEGSYGDWWMGQCGLSGGASGGPWLDPVDSGNGTIMSVNSWGYTNQPGMAGPNLSSTGSSGQSASCVFDAAKAAVVTTEPRGVIPAC